MSAPREYPILFSGAMVRALLDGTKTQTRRVVTAKVWDQDEDGKRRQYVTRPGVWGDGREMTAADVTERFGCPYGRPGGRLWVRETWKYENWTEDGDPYIEYRATPYIRLCEPPEEWADRVAYVWADLSAPDNYAIDGCARDRRWRSPRHQPRWASRITLELTDVRVERVQEISEEDAKAEGITVEWQGVDELIYGPGKRVGFGYPDQADTARGAFRLLWDTINARRGYGWDANPFVWVLSFRRV